MIRSDDGLAILLGRQSLALRFAGPLFHDWRQSDTLNGANFGEVVAANDKPTLFIGL